MSVQGTLLVFAHGDEAVAFADVPHLITGVGKINAVVSLAKALAQGGYTRVVVLGTAGVVTDGADRPRLDTIYQVTALVQHDFELASPTIPTAGETVLPRELQVTMATGDQFVTNDEQRTHIAGLGAQLVDMEGYAFAKACEVFDVPLQIFKVPSDYADSSTTMEEWDEIAVAKSHQLRAFWDTQLANS